MTFQQWGAAVNQSLRVAKRGYNAYSIDPNLMQSAFEAGESPVLFAKREAHQKRWQTSPKDVSNEPERFAVPQSRAVKSDPKYQLDTGFGLFCPTCGSTFIRPISKPGTGLGYWGSVQWVLAAGAFESLVKAGQPQPYQCGYCEAVFTQGAVEPAALRLDTDDLQ